MAGDRKNVKIIMASHKEASFPDDAMYVPVLAGSSLYEGEIPEGFKADNDGENISFLNPMYCELTALYWGWKNLPDITGEDAYLGLVHYRRFFGTEKKGPVKYEDIEPYLGKYKIILPTKRHYYIDSLRLHYEHTHGSAALDECEKIINESYPQMVECFETALGRTSGYMFNMMIMRGDIIDSYLKWLFAVLDELCTRLDSSGMDAYDNRFPGRISELLLNVWLEYQEKIGFIKSRDIKVIPMYCTTGEKTAEKARALLKAKFKGEKYHGSF